MQSFCSDGRSVVIYRPICVDDTDIWATTLHQMKAPKCVVRPRQRDQCAKDILADIVFPRKTYSCLYGLKAMEEDVLVQPLALSCLQHYHLAILKQSLPSRAITGCYLFHIGMRGCGAWRRTTCVRHSRRKAA